MKAAQYIEITLGAVPHMTRFDVPRRHQGQAIEIAYGGESRAEHDNGAPFKRVNDRSTKIVKYYRLSDA